MADSSELAAIHAEIARLIALLETHGIEWRLPQPAAIAAQESEPSRLSTAEKVALFRRLFRGRTDVGQEAVRLPGEGISARLQRSRGMTPRKCRRCLQFSLPPAATRRTAN